MEENKKVGDKDFISYLDDDSQIKNQWVIILKKNSYGVEFRFEDNNDTIFLPWNRVLKIKEKGNKDGD